jgi:chemotaxis response regulator CheB
MLVSAQNRQMLVNVIGGSIGGVKNLRKVLSNFDVHFVQKSTRTIASNYSMILKKIFV